MGTVITEQGVMVQETPQTLYELVNRQSVCIDEPHFDYAGFCLCDLSFYDQSCVVTNSTCIGS